MDIPYDTAILLRTCNAQLKAWGRDSPGHSVGSGVPPAGPASLLGWPGSLTSSHPLSLPQPPPLTCIMENVISPSPQIGKTHSSKSLEECLAPGTCRYLHGQSSLIVTYLRPHS